MQKLTKPLLRTVALVMFVLFMAVSLMPGHACAKGKGKAKGKNKTTIIYKLPRGYKAVKINGKKYFHHKGVYYQPYKKGFIVVKTPVQKVKTVTKTKVHRVGTTIVKLPAGYKTMKLNGKKYFHHNGIYYQTHKKGFIVVNAPVQKSKVVTTHRVGTTVVKLPAGYKKLRKNGRVYFIHNNVYYQKGAKGYIIVKKP